MCVCVHIYMRTQCASQTPNTHAPPGRHAAVLLSVAYSELCAPALLADSTSPPRNDVGVTTRLHFSISGNCLLEYIIGTRSDAERPLRCSPRARLGYRGTSLTRNRPPPGPP